VRSRPLYVICFLALLAIPQALALAWQFHDGYRPFKAAPTRVALSWDMFAVRIERCDVFWNPPLPVPGRAPLARLHQLASRLEWDFPLDTQADYRALTEWSCGRFKHPFHANLICLTPEGKVATSAVECR
jgi:hypothetical protein